MKLAVTIYGIQKNNISVVVICPCCLLTILAEIWKYFLVHCNNIVPKAVKTKSGLTVDCDNKY